MGIFYYEEHAGCSNYVKDVHIGFKYLEVKQGTVFSVDDKKEQHLFFFLEGCVKVRYNEFYDKEFTAGEMIFLPRSADCRGEALTDCTFIMLVYDNPVKLCDKTTLESIVNCARHVEYEFKSLPIRGGVMQFLHLLRMYLSDGVNCRHLHEIKQKELFLLFRIYYQKEELAQLFFPMLGKAMDFRSKVMTHYLTVRTAKELAAICMYSESRFGDLFLEEFGESPYQWIQKQKSKHIVGRLSDQNIPIKDIVDEFNFSCPSHFNKYCIKQFGETPVQVRQKLIAENQVKRHR